MRAAVPNIIHVNDVGRENFLLSLHIIIHNSILRIKFAICVNIYCHYYSSHSIGTLAINLEVKREAPSFASSSVL